MLLITYFDVFVLLQAAFVVSLDEEPQEYDRVSIRVISGYCGRVNRSVYAIIIVE